MSTTSIEILVRRLEEQFEEPLPGFDGQRRLAPRPRDGWQPGVIPADCRKGAGLLLLYPAGEAETVHTVLTVRDPSLPQHAGQVALAGGAVEAGESPIEAALREAQEEIGVDPGTVRILGPLTPLHIPVSGFVLYPIVGVADCRPNLHPELGEVARILEVSLDELCDPSRLGVERQVHGSRAYEVPYLLVGGEKVWGATAMILSEFLCLLGSEPSPFDDLETREAPDPSTV